MTLPKSHLNALLTQPTPSSFLRLPKPSREAIYTRHLSAPGVLRMCNGHLANESTNLLSESALRLLSSSDTGSDLLAREALEWFYGNNYFLVGVEDLEGLVKVQSEKRSVRGGFDPRGVIRRVGVLCQASSSTSDGEEKVGEGWVNAMLETLAQCSRLEEVVIFFIGDQADVSHMEKLVGASTDMLQVLDNRVTRGVLVAKEVSDEDEPTEWDFVTLPWWDEFKVVGMEVLGRYWVQRRFVRG